MMRSIYAKAQASERYRCTFAEGPHKFDAPCKQKRSSGSIAGSANLEWNLSERLIEPIENAFAFACSWLVQRLNCWHRAECVPLFISFAVALCLKFNLNAPS